MCYLLKSGVPWHVAVGDEINAPLNELWSCALFIVFNEIDGGKFNLATMTWETK